LINYFFLPLLRFLKENKFQIIRFISAGLFASVINFLIYNLTYELFKIIELSAISGYFSGLLYSFIMAKFWVFKDRSRKNIPKKFSIFITIYILGGIEMSLIIILINYLINNHNIAWLCGACIASLNNYLGTKILLFKS